MVEEGGARRHWPHAVLVLVGLALFVRPLLLGETLYFRDLYSYFLPQKALLAESIRAGHWPLWNPLLQGGQPYLANLASGALYPVNPLYGLLPTLTAFNVDVVLHVLRLALGTCFLARSLGLGPTASFIAGLVACSGGLSLSLVNLFNLLHAAALIPLMLLLWERALSRRSGWAFASCVAAGTAQVFAGAPEVNAITLLLLLGWSLARSHPEVKPVRRSVLWVVLSVFIIGCSAVQMLPGAEIAGVSERGSGLDRQVVEAWSLHPLRLVEFVLPGFFGPVGTLRDSDYWGYRLLDGFFPYLLSLYTGASVVILAWIGACTRRVDGGVFSRRERVFFSCSILLSVLVALGRFLPGWSEVAAAVPLQGCSAIRARL